MHKMAMLCNGFLQNHVRDICFPIFIRKEFETRKLERKSKQQISRLNDLLYRLNDIINKSLNRYKIDFLSFLFYIYRINKTY